MGITWADVIILSVILIAAIVYTIDRSIQNKKNKYLEDQISSFYELHKLIDEEFEHISKVITK